MCALGEGGHSLMLKYTDFGKISVEGYIGQSTKVGVSREAERNCYVTLPYSKADK